MPDIKLLQLNHYQYYKSYQNILQIPSFLCIRREVLYNGLRNKIPRQVDPEFNLKISQFNVIHRELIDLAGNEDEIPVK